MVGSPCSPRDSQESSPTPEFKSISSLVLSFLQVQLLHPYVTSGKTIALSRRTFVGKVIPLLFNMLSRLVITFLRLYKKNVKKANPQRSFPSILIFLWILSFWRPVWRFLKKTGNRTAILPSNSTAGHTHWGNQNWKRHVYPNVHRSTVHTRTWKQPRCPSADEWIRKLWYIYSGVLLSH